MAHKVFQAQASTSFLAIPNPVTTSRYEATVPASVCLCSPPHPPHERSVPSGATLQVGQLPRTPEPPSGSPQVVLTSHISSSEINV